MLVMSSDDVRGVGGGLESEGSGERLGSGHKQKLYPGSTCVKRPAAEVTHFTHFTLLELQLGRNSG